MKILFFTFGDSSLKKTWSNVPYCFSTALEEIGHDVVRVNLNNHSMLSDLWNNHGVRILRKLFKGHQYDWMRTVTCRRLVELDIRKALKQHPDTGLCVFTTFSFTNLYNRVPSVNFCDWTYETHLQRNGHKPYFFEQLFIKYERKVLEHTAKAVSLFPVCADAINQQLGVQKVEWSGLSAPNVVDDRLFDISAIVKGKVNSKEILFIGDGKYLSGARLLCEVVKKLHSEDTDVKLSIIGLTSKDLGLENETFVQCYGYLDKGKEEDCIKYYELLRNAAVFCNPTEVWGGFSSTIEAMYYATPVVVSPYQDFVEQFGEEITFGIYNRLFDISTLYTNLKTVLYMSALDREKMAVAAHDIVKNNTWISYASKIIALADKR